MKLWVTVIAPPSGDRKWHCSASYTVQRGWKFSTSSSSRPLATRPRMPELRAWRGLRSPAPRGAGAPSCVGCEGPFNAACSFNIIFLSGWLINTLPSLEPVASMDKNSVRCICLLEHCLAPGVPVVFNTYLIRKHGPWKNRMCWNNAGL